MSWLEEALHQPVIETVECPHCGAGLGMRCFTSCGRYRSRPHNARFASYEQIDWTHSQTSVAEGTR